MSYDTDHDLVFGVGEAALYPIATTLASLRALSSIHIDGFLATPTEELAKLENVSPAITGDMKLIRGGETQWPLAGQSADKGLILTAGKVDIQAKVLAALLNGGTVGTGVPTGYDTVTIADTEPLYYRMLLKNPSDQSSLYGFAMLLYRVKPEVALELALARNDWMLHDVRFHAFWDSDESGVAEIIKPTEA